MKSSSPKANENAKMFLSGTEKRVKKAGDDAQFAIFRAVVSLDKYPITYSEERSISNLCRVSTSASIPRYIHN